MSSVNHDELHSAFTHTTSPYLVVRGGRYGVRSDRPTVVPPPAAGWACVGRIGRDDADRSVGFEGRKLQLVDAIETVLAERSFDVDQIEALPHKLGQEPLTVTPDDGRPEFEDAPDQ